jgi:negative regulator of replication initiation
MSNIKNFIGLYNLIDSFSLGTTLREIKGKTEIYFDIIDKLLLSKSPEEIAEIQEKLITNTNTKNIKEKEIKTIAKALDHYCMYYV